MPEFLDHLRAAISALEQELEKDPRYVALRSLRQVYTSVSSGEPSPPQIDSPVPQRPTPHRVPTPDTTRVVEQAREFLAGRTDPVPLRDLYLELTERRGCRIGGVNPINGLSAILSRNGFVAHGRAGWTNYLSPLQK